MKIDKNDQVKSFIEKPNENRLDDFKTILIKKIFSKYGNIFFKTSF